jgi:hypothetical protein
MIRRIRRVSYLDPFSLVALLLAPVFRPEAGSDFSSEGDPKPVLKRKLFSFLSFERNHN